MSSARESTTRALAAAFVAGPLAASGLIERATQLLGEQAPGNHARWLRPLTRRVEARFGGGPRPRAAVVAKFLLADKGFGRAFEKHALRLVQRVSSQQVMAPLDAARGWRVAPLSTPAQLADWLGLPPRQLDWFADRRGFERKHCHGPLRHYHYRPLTKRFGRTRLIESPKPRLKGLQRQILAGVLDRVPPHDAAHGFRQGRSIKTFAAPHAAQRAVLKLDLEDFFPSIAAARVSALYRSLGYPEPVADLLSGLCTNAAPEDVWAMDVATTARRRQLQQRLYAQPHLPQGAPTSPALANLCAYRLDCRLAALATAAGGVYTRYADDLAFSGGDDFARCVRRFRVHVCAAVMEEGFAINHHKTRVMLSSQRQRLAGLTVNNRPAVGRRERDALKATLTNCVRSGPAGQNRASHADFRSHLNGRVAFVEMVCPEQGAKLRRLFCQIRWSGHGGDEGDA